MQGTRKDFYWKGRCLSQKRNTLATRKKYLFLALLGGGVREEEIENFFWYNSHARKGKSLLGGRGDLLSPGPHF